jgi:hypothetical protein
MGIQKSTGGRSKVIFADIKGKAQDYEENGVTKHGSIVLTHPDKTKEILPNGSAITGFVTDIDVSSHVYQGDTIDTLKIRIEDESGEAPTVLANVTLGSYFAAKITGLLNAADLSKPITLAAGFVKEGDKMGDKVADKDFAWATVRQGADRTKLEPVWADGRKDLPEAPMVKVSGKSMKNMEPVNEVVVATIKELYGKLEQQVEQDKAPGDDGVDLAEVSAAANEVSDRGAMRARG